MKNIDDNEKFKNFIKKNRKGFQEIASIASELQGMKFENKFTVQGDYDVLGRVLQSLGTSMQPIPTPSLADSYLARGFNLLYGEDILEEYVSYDDDKLRTMGGRLDYLSQNAGIPSLVLEQMRSFERALEMSKEGSTIIFTYFQMTIVRESFADV
mgnify:CR=1 FL=1